MKYFLAYDVGTSSVKSILVDETGNILASAIGEYPLHMPNPGWAEQEPLDYWNAICTATKQLVATTNISLSHIKGIVFTAQAMGLIPVNKQGEVLHPNICWVDGRAEKQARNVMRRFGGKAAFRMISGIELTGKDVVPKMVWLKEHKPELFNSTYKFLDVSGYLRYKCTNRMSAEWSGACSYSFDVKKKDWEHLFFKIAGVGTDKLPDLVRSIDEVGTLTEQAAYEMGLSTGIPVYGGCDDTQSAAVGTTAIGEGEAHAYLGTSAWVGVTTRKSMGFKGGAFCLQSADPEMNLVVGVTESAGVNTEWLLCNFYEYEKQTLSTHELFEKLEKDINQISAGADFLIVTPWFLGERCPINTTTTRSTIFNLSHQHTRAHIARAHFEGIAYNLRWTIQHLENNFGFKINELKVTGGGTYSKTWMQIISDVTQRKIITTSQPKNAGALGGAMCAMVGSGIFKSFNEIQKLIQHTETFIPNIEHQKVYNTLFENYQNIFQQLNRTYANINHKRFESE